MHVSSVARSHLEPVEGRDGAGGAYPLWAHWNGGVGQRYTLGVEEEVMLLDPRSWSLAQSSDEVLAGLSDELAPQTAPETHAGVVELVTGVHSHVDGVVRELGSLRSRLASELDAMRLSTAAGGTHPLTVWAETEVSGAPRSEVLAENRFLAARDGMDARLIDAATRRLTPVHETLSALLAKCRPHAVALGCATALDRVLSPAAVNGADRQRVIAAGDGRPDRLVAGLAARFRAPEWPATMAGRSA